MPMREYGCILFMMTLCLIILDSPAMVFVPFTALAQIVLIKVIVVLADREIPSRKGGIRPPDQRPDS